jgi:hypothetical protein
MIQKKNIDDINSYILQEWGVFNWIMPDCEELIEILLGGVPDFEGLSRG